MTYMKTGEIRIAEILDDEIILERREDAEKLRGLGTFAIHGPNGPRSWIGVRVVLCDLGKVIAFEPVRNTVPLACAGDTIVGISHVVDSYDADHAALLAYMYSAIRRSDWHAVSDCANDLRVLEAVRGARK